MAYCRLDAENAVLEVIHYDPKGRFHPSVAWVECPASTLQGATYDPKSGKFTNLELPLSPEPSEPAPETEPTFRLKLTPSEFRNAFSAFEEVAITDYAAARPDGEEVEKTTLRKVVGVFFDRLRDQHLTTVDLEDPRNLAGLDILVSVGILTADRRAAIARGLPG